MKYFESFRKALGLSAVVFAAMLWSGCETVQPSGGQGPGASAGSTSVAHAETSSRFNRGDRLTVQFYDAPVAPTEQVVREDGTISLPMNQTVVALGKTKGEIEAAIQAIYVPKFFRRMTVNIKPEERFFFVSGEVRNPGQKVHTGNITVLKAIAAAGDFTDFANRSNIKITRADGTEIKVNGKKAMDDSSKDIPVYPNDKVWVDRRFF